MPRRRGGSPASKVLPQIEAADYPEIAALIEDMHPTWQEWRRERSAFEMSARRQGHSIKYIHVAAAALSAWAAGNGKTTLTLDDLTTYVHSVAARK
jgi:hypothetical protein